MAENTAVETTHDDDLGDEALDRLSEGKLGCVSNSFRPGK